LEYSAAPSHGFIRYRPDIDGLRAFAVLAVVVYHALPAVLPGGFIGVDIFFVISGYLISGQIFGELRQGRFNLAAFYGRRVRRIFPALAIVLLATLSYGFVILLPSELAELGGDVAGGAGFAANLMLWQEAGYFDRAAMLKPLLHLWSLGVEEQFYVVWPITLWALYRVGWLRQGLLVGLAGASFALSVVLAGQHPAADFYSPYTRFWELAAGALLAWMQRPCTVMADAISLVGLFLLSGSLVLLNSQMQFPGWLAMIPVLGALLLLGAGPEAWVNRKLLSRRVAVRIGLVSYPFYLWHWPLISYAHFLNEARPLKTFPAICLIAAALGLAAATYQWLERPLRFGGAKRGKTIFLSAVMLVTGGFGAATWAEHGFPGRFPPLPNVDITKINVAVRDGIFKPTPHMRVIKLDGITVAELGDTGSAIMFTGDSVLFQWGPRAEELLDEGRLRHRVYFVVGASCRPFPGVTYAPAFAFCANMGKAQAQVIQQDHIGTIVIGALWQGTFGNAPLSATKLYAGIEDELAVWVRQGHGVYLILPTPVGTGFDPAMMVTHRLTGFDVDQAMLKGVPMAQLVAGMAPISSQLKMLAQQAGAKTLDPLTDICGKGPVCSPFFAAGEPKFSDPNHLRPIFVRSNIMFFDQILTN